MASKMVKTSENSLTRIALWMALAVSVGCDASAPVYPVNGQVLIDGKPATTGSIRFVPENGRPATSEIDDSGRFQMATQLVNGQKEGLLPGVYRVAVTSNEIVDEETARWLAPAEYADFRTSGLEVEVDGPLDGVKIELTWKGAAGASEESASANAPALEHDEDAVTSEPDSTASNVN